MFTRPSKEISVIIVGTLGSGKSALTARLLGKKFPALPRPTNGINFTSTSHLDPQNASKTLKLHIADTSGDRRFSDSVARYLVDVNAVVYVIDPTIFPGKQFQKIIDWLEDTCQQARLVIVISKADTLETEDDRRAIELVVSQFVKRMMEIHGVDFSLYSVSAKNDNDPGLTLLSQHILALPGNTPPLTTAMVMNPSHHFQMQSHQFAPRLFYRPMPPPPLPHDPKLISANLRLLK
jgi:small GTP-binding protein